MSEIARLFQILGEINVGGSFFDFASKRQVDLPVEFRSENFPLVRNPSVRRET